MCCTEHNIIGQHLLCDIVLLDKVVELDVLQEEVCGDLISAKQADHQLVCILRLFLLLGKFLLIYLFIFFNVVRRIFN